MTFRILLPFLYFCLFGGLSLMAQSDPKNVRPGTILLSAYQTVTDAEKLEESKQFKAAWNKYHQALRYYKTLSSAHPTWKPHIVNGRIQSTTDAIDRVAPMAHKQDLAEKNKFKDFIEGDERTGTAAATPPSTNAFTPDERKQLGNLNTKLTSLQQQLEQERNKHTSEKLKLNEQINQLQTELRKNQQGLGRESSQTRMLNGEIAKLQLELRKAQQLDQSSQQKLIDTIEELQRARNKIATAPLREDVEKLHAAKRRQELELQLLATDYQVKKQELQKSQQSIAELQQQNALQKDMLAQNEKQLAAARTAANSIVHSLREENKRLKESLQSANHKITEQSNEIKRLMTRLSESEALSKDLRDELADMTRERDQLSELLKLSDADRGKQLMKENLRLARELRDKELALQQLHKDKNFEQDRVIEAENKLAVAKQQLIRIRDENTEFRKRITHLEDSLESTKEQLTNQTQPPKDSAAQEEVELLKDTVNRLLARQTRRRQAEKLLWDAYQKMAQRSEPFEAAYRDLDTATVKLSDREREILRNNQSQDTLVNPASTVDEETRRIAQQQATTQIDTFNTLAKRFIEKDQLEIARDVYDEAYETIPDYSFLINRGVIRMRLNQPEEAETIFKMGVSQRPRNPYTHFMLGMARLELQKDDLAEKSMESAINLKPDYPTAFFYRGIIDARNGRNDQAKENFETAIRLDPDFKEAYFNLSYLHHIMGNQKNAQKAYNNALRSGLPPNLEFERKIGISS